MRHHGRKAGAIVLLRNPTDPEVYWVERAADTPFLGGYHAFVGGAEEPGDRELAEAADAGGAVRVAAVRELFEETGVLLADGERELSTSELAAAAAALDGGQSFASVLAQLAATPALAKLRPAGNWLTPAFAPRRFDTHFFLAWLPPGQEPAVRTPELARGGFIRPAAALAAWQAAEVLLAPPVRHILAALAQGVDDALELRLHAPEAARGVPSDRIEFLPGIVLVPLLTDTLPPASHTNAYVIGRDAAVVIDPGSAQPVELDRLCGVLDELAAEGVRVGEILLTHQHRDHVAGAAALATRRGLRIAAHAETAERLPGLPIGRLIEDGERLELGAGYALTALHTPGHAPGHLAFLEARTGALLSGDNVIGLGSVLIDPSDGAMGPYLASLERLGGLGARAIFGGHGPALAHPARRIRELIAHRQAREQAVLGAVRSGLREASAIAAAAYRDSPRAPAELALRQTIAHLEELVRVGRLRAADGRYQLA